ncbi:MAG: HAD family hydrolase [Pirellulales bacterium]
MSHIDIIRRLSQPLSPRPTDVRPELEPLEGIRAVLFDVYGTLLASASGDIGLAGEPARAGAMDEALAAVGCPLRGDGDRAVAILHAVIKRHHAESSYDFPEVEIHDVWRDALNNLHEIQAIETVPDAETVDRLAVEYEMRVNPVWPMPGVAETLHALHDANLLLGIVSNAQVFTAELFPALVGATLDDLGFRPALCCWSYEHRRAKPGTHLYERATHALAEFGVAGDEVLYVGNDMRNDIAPAQRVGFRTALFAGDARSLRWRIAIPSSRGCCQVGSSRIYARFPRC